MTSYWGAGTMIEGILQSKNVLPAVTPMRQQQFGYLHPPSVSKLYIALPAGHIALPSGTSVIFTGRQTKFNVRHTNIYISKYISMHYILTHCESLYARPFKTQTRLRTKHEIQLDAFGRNIRCHIPRLSALVNFECGKTQERKILLVFNFSRFLG